MRYVELFRYLSAHPHVYMSSNKEPDFFVERRPDVERLRQFFDPGFSGWGIA